MIQMYVTYMHLSMCACVRACVQPICLSPYHVFLLHHGLLFQHTYCFQSCMIVLLVNKGNKDQSINHVRF